MMQARPRILVGGTGSGKSTSLAAMVGYRNENSYGHIITIEDPVEYVHEHKNCVVTQRDVGVDTDSWHAALKNTLRQAPDVILIGEIRDRETMEYAIEFAETGHLCMATLHANSANQALDRIINFFPEERRAAAADGPVAQHPRASSRSGCPARRTARAASPPWRSCSIRRSSPDLIFKGDVHEIKDDHGASRASSACRPSTRRLFELYETGLHQLRGRAAQRRLGERAAAHDQAEQQGSQGQGHDGRGQAP